MISVVLALALSVASAGDPAVPTPADPAPASERQITKPVWISIPVGQDLARLYPPEAMREGASGGAVIGCTVKADGRLTDCKVLEETPGLGFGEASLRLMGYFRMKPTDEAGQPVTGATVRLPIRWNAPPGS